MEDCCSRKGRCGLLEDHSYHLETSLQMIFHFQNLKVFTCEKELKENSILFRKKSRKLRLNHNPTWMSSMELATVSTFFLMKGTTQTTASLGKNIWEATRTTRATRRSVVRVCMTLVDIMRIIFE